MGLYHHVLYQLWVTGGEGVKISLFLTKTRGILFLKSIDIFFFFAIMGLSKAAGRSRSSPGGI